MKRRPKVVVAMDSFKGTMSARDACALVRDGIHEVAPTVEVILVPMADGGEGTAEALMTARGGDWITCSVIGPLPDMTVAAGFAWFEDDRTALVEMAMASGIMLVPRDQLDPLRATTYGTGQCLQAALDHGAERLILAVGGSATTDGGVGAAQALGWRILDAEDQPVPLGGGGLSRIARIIPPINRVTPPLEVLCDVTNPLTGPEGSAAVFGPQKGATPAMIQQLDAGLVHWAHTVRTQLGVEIETLPGAGAAGGLAAGMVACMAAKLVPGIDTVMSASGLAGHMAEADWVISGEGRFDRQSLGGKVVSGIQRLARDHRIQVGVIAGAVQVDEAVCKDQGLAFAWSTAPAETPVAEALKTAREDLRATARRFAETHLCAR